MKRITINRGHIALTVASIIPLVLWSGRSGLPNVFDSPGGAVSMLGKASAIAGMVLYCAMPLLSMRHQLIVIFFGGLNNLYETHKSVGKLAFYLILLHPVLYASGNLISGASFGSVWDWTSLLILSGIFAMIVLIFATTMSIYAHIKHQKWIWVHRLLGWLIPVFFFHGLIAKSQIVKNDLLLTYMLTVGMLGFGAFLYRSVLSKYFLKRYKYVVEEVHNMTESITEVVLKPLGVPINYEAGQFAFLSFESDVVDSEAHPYSFSSADNGPYVRFTVKALGDDTTKLQHVKPGTKTYLEGPYGDFNYRNIRNTNQVWIAGGIGVTPFLSMARSLSDNTNHNVKFFYGSESLSDTVFLKEFMEISHGIPQNFEVNVITANVSGFVSLDMLNRSIEDLKTFDYLICGPPRMMSALSAQLVSAGVPEEQIHTEAFSM